MSWRTALKNIHKLDVVIEPILRAARIPGVAIAVVAGRETVYAKGFGYCDVRSKKPIRLDTVYPIASTTKAMNATLLGMLVDEGYLGWDVPVQHYLPQFRLKDTVISSRITIRDLVTMRTGLPRHDWVWMGRRITRAELVEHFPHLELSADFRQRFQYCNLSATIAGHIAELVTGSNWETLVRERIFYPLGMRRTSCTRPLGDNVTLSYHENARRKLLLTQRLPTEVTAPAGGAVHSTVEDMAQWVSFNLNGGRSQGRRLISLETLAQIHAPQVILGDRSLTGLPPDAAYALGWVVDSYNGHKRISHGGYLHDVNSSVVFFPHVGIGMVSFINFGCPGLAEVINQYAFNELMGLACEQTFQGKLKQYEKKIRDVRKRNESVKRVANTQPVHPLSDYVGRYDHAAYGEIKVKRRGRRLILVFRELLLPLRHWHYDVWIAEDNDLWAIHLQHAFDRASPIQFYTNAQGEIANLSISLEPEVAPIRFAKQ